MSGWLAEELTAFGFAVEPQPFTISQFFPKDQHLEIGDESLPVFPHWLPDPTSSPVEARLQPIRNRALSGTIAYLDTDHAGPWLWGPTH